MPKIPITTTGLNPLLSKNFTVIKELLNGGLGVDNFKGRILEGTTSSSAHTSALFRHSMTPQPYGGLVVMGNAYIYEITDTYVDIRSSQTSTDFTLVLVAS